MLARDSLSRLALPLLGAVAVTAGAVLFQITRKPNTHPEPAQPLQRTMTLAKLQTSHAAPGPRASTPRPSDDDGSLLQRLRERGL